MSGWYARRAVAWLPLLACTALGALFGVVELNRSSGWEPLAYALFGLVPAAACAVDEPAAAVVDSGAATLRWRTAARAAGLVVPAGVFGVLVVWVAGRPGAPALLLLADGWILMGLAFGTSVILRRSGRCSPARLVAPAAVLVLTADLVLSDRLHPAVQVLNVESYAPWIRLSGLGFVGAVLLVVGTRDFASSDWS